MANYCSQVLSGIGLTCNNTIGGIRAVYIANRGDVTAATIEDEVITALSLSSSAKFHKYLFRKNSSSNMVSTKSGDDAAGTHVITTNVVMTFAGMDTEKRVEMDALSVGQFLVIVEDRNGKFWMPILPTEDYMAASAGEGNTGSTTSEANQYTITLTGDANHYPYEVEAAAMSSIVATL